MCVRSRHARAVLTRAAIINACHASGASVVERFRLNCAYEPLKEVGIKVRVGKVSVNIRGITVLVKLSFSSRCKPHQRHSHLCISPAGRSPACPVSRDRFITAEVFWAPAWTVPGSSCGGCVSTRLGRLVLRLMATPSAADRSSSAVTSSSTARSRSLVASLPGCHG